MIQAAIENTGDSKYHATASGFGFVLDTGGQGVNPIEALLASLCACIGHYVRDYLDEQRLACPGFTVDAQAALAPDKSRLGEIQLWIDLKDAAVDGQRANALLGYVERCKIHQTLKASCRISIELGRRAQAAPRPLAVTGEG